MSVAREGAPDGAPIRLGRYDVLTEIAAGGMATVYLARTAGLAGFDRFFAIKCIHADLADQPEFVDMFLDEARLTSALTHPNCCNVVEVGVEEGVHFLVMEYLHGQPLSSIARRWRKEPPAPSLRALAVARMIAGACAGLHAAHELRDPRGRSLEVIHRDVSPQNLFLTYDGAMKVVDFGIARAVGRLHETTAAVLKGKLSYLSPEYVRQRPVDRRLDVWALGVVMWELLTGGRLFKRPNQFATIKAIVQGPIPPLADIEPGYPVDLQRIVSKALARDPDARYPDARELQRDLERWIASTGEPFGSVELAELMQVFADERAEAEAMLARARRGETQAPAALPRATSGGSLQIESAGPTDLESAGSTDLESAGPTDLDRTSTDAVATSVSIGPRRGVPTSPDGGPRSAVTAQGAVDGPQRSQARPAPQRGATTVAGGGAGPPTGTPPLGGRTPSEPRPAGPSAPESLPETDPMREPPPAPAPEPAEQASLAPVAAAQDRPSIEPRGRGSLAWIFLVGALLGGSVVGGAAVYFLQVEQRAAQSDGDRASTAGAEPTAASDGEEPAPDPEEAPTDVVPEPSPEEVEPSAPAPVPAPEPSPTTSAPTTSAATTTEEGTSEQETSEGEGRRRAEPREPERPARPRGPPVPVGIATSGGWARVSVDGRDVGNTPVRVSLTPGRHSVVLVPGGTGVPIRRTIEVGPGRPNRLHVAL